MIQLSRRERIYVGVGGGFLAVVLGYLLVVRPYVRGIDAARARIETGRGEILTMVDLYKRHAALAARLAEIERRIPADESFSTLSAMEQLAQEAGISGQIEKMEERKKVEGEFYREQAVEVTVRRIPLASLVDYLYKIESSPTLLVIRKLTVSTRYDQKDLLDATVEVSSFRPR